MEVLLGMINALLRLGLNNMLSLTWDKWDQTKGMFRKTLDWTVDFLSLPIMLLTQKLHFAKTTLQRKLLVLLFRQRN